MTTKKTSLLLLRLEHDLDMSERILSGKEGNLHMLLIQQNQIQALPEHPLRTSLLNEMKHDIKRTESEVTMYKAEVEEYKNRLAYVSQSYVSQSTVPPPPAL